MSEKKTSLAKIQFWLGIAISGLMISWLAFNVDWSQVLNELKNIRYVILIPAIVFFVLHFLLRAVRWKLLLSPDSLAPIKLLYDSMMVGNLATFLIPLRVGEFVRPYMLSRCSNVSFGASFVSVVIERFFDLSTVLLCFGLLLLMLDPTKQSVDPLVYKSALFLGAVAFLIFLFILVAVYYPSFVSWACGIATKPLPRSLKKIINSFLTDFLQGAKSLRSGNSLVRILFWTALVWLTTFIRFWIAMAAFPSLEPSVTLSIACGVLVSLAIAAPSAPGFVGVYEGGCIAAFALFGLSKESATAYAIVTHILEYLLVGGFGCLGLFRNDLKLGDLLSRKVSDSEVHSA